MSAPSNTKIGSEFGSDRANCRMRELAGGQRIVSNQAMQALSLLVKQQLARFTLNDKLVSWANVKCWSCGRPMAYEKTVCWRNMAIDFGGLFRVYTPCFVAALVIQSAMCSLRASNEACLREACQHLHGIV